MKIKEIKQLSGKELGEMSTAELRKIANTLAFEANKMIKRLEGSNLLSASLSYNMNKGKKKKTYFFKTKSKIKRKVKPLKKNPKRAYSKRELELHAKKERALERMKKQELLENIARTKAFIDAPSSTPTGAEETKKTLSNDIGEEWDNLSDRQKNKFWDIYAKLRDEYPDIFQEGGDYLKLRERIFEMMILGTKRLRNEEDVEAMFKEWVETGAWHKPTRPRKSDREQLDEIWFSEKEFIFK